MPAALLLPDTPLETKTGEKVVAGDLSGAAEAMIPMATDALSPVLSEAVAAHGVTKLVLRDNQLGPEAGAGLAEVLRRGVEYLDLSFNDLGAASADAAALLS